MCTALSNCFRKCIWGENVLAAPAIPYTEEIELKLIAGDSGRKKQDMRAWENFIEWTTSREFPGNFSLHDLMEQIDGTGRRALDLGCGAGRDTELLLNNDWHVTAVDMCPLAINHLNPLKSTHSDKLEIVLSTLEDFPFTENYDLIVAHNVLGFCAPGKIKAIWDRMYSSLYENGCVLCSLPVPIGGNYSEWSMNREEMIHFFIDRRFTIIDEIPINTPDSDHPTRLILQKIE